MNRHHPLLQPPLPQPTHCPHAQAAFGVDVPTEAQTLELVSRLHDEYPTTAPRPSEDRITDYDDRITDYASPAGGIDQEAIDQETKMLLQETREECERELSLTRRYLQTHRAPGLSDLDGLIRRATLPATSDHIAKPWAQHRLLMYNCIARLYYAHGTDREVEGFKEVARLLSRAGGLELMRAVYYLYTGWLGAGIEDHTECCGEAPGQVNNALFITSCHTMAFQDASLCIKTHWDGVGGWMQ